ncbi:uncharacterized protein LOC127567224 isoform X2 [Pristis pectinata]|uniref:uncharacterized protein LOC127567224 isoform X2 n=1 Tax=Pristis pectinata TaxID=685728 RepID=UPI00223D352F|nr:uncharacterized protein LOC127567224 isoform X2 [Pristis pectinata]
MGQEPVLLTVLVVICLSSAGSAAPSDDPVIEQLLNELRVAANSSDPVPRILLALRLTTNVSSEVWPLCQRLEEQTAQDGINLSSGMAGLYVLAMIACCVDPSHVPDPSPGPPVNLLAILSDKVDAEMKTVGRPGPPGSLRGKGLGEQGPSPDLHRRGDEGRTPFRRHGGDVRPRPPLPPGPGRQAPGRRPGCPHQTHHGIVLCTDRPGHHRQHLQHRAGYAASEPESWSLPATGDPILIRVYYTVHCSQDCWHSIRLAVRKGATILDAMRVAERERPQFKFKQIPTAWGPYITSIGGTEASSQDRTYWEFLIGTQPIPVGVAEYKLSDGDHIFAKFTTY